MTSLTVSVTANGYAGGFAMTVIVPVGRGSGPKIDCPAAEREAADRGADRPESAPASVTSS